MGTPPGATGNIGMAVTEGSCGAGRRSAAWSASPAGGRRRAAAGRRPRGRRRPPTISARLAGADVVIHLAWLFQPTHQPLVTWQANVSSTPVFDAALAAGVGAVVHASSVGAYSPGTGDDPVDESWPTHSCPRPPTGEKAYVERLLGAVEARHPPTAGSACARRSCSGARPPRAAAPVPRPPGAPVAPAARAPARGPGPGRPRFQAVHGTDLARAVAAVAVGDARGAFNVASDPVIDVARLGDVMGAAWWRCPLPGPLGGGRGLDRAGRARRPQPGRPGAAPADHGHRPCALAGVGTRRPRHRRRAGGARRHRSGRRWRHPPWPRTRPPGRAGELASGVGGGTADEPIGAITANALMNRRRVGRRPGLHEPGRSTWRTR